MKNTLPVLFLSVISIIPLAASAFSSKDIATETFQNTHLSFSQKVNLGSSTLTVSGPNDFFASKSLASGIPTIELSNFGEVSDGIYKYQIYSALEGKFKKSTGSTLNNGRGHTSQQQENESATQSGNFRIVNGSIMTVQTTSQSSSQSSSH